MKTVKLKILNICSNGSSFFSFSANFKNLNQLFFSKKDYISLFPNKKIDFISKIDFINKYKKKYLT
jgi:hypothetical protein